MLKVAYIGFGNSVCRYHLPYVEKRKDFIDVKYIYRLETEINEEKESWYPGIKFTSSINEIMDDPDVNLVVVNTPDRYHVEYTMQALDHGKHVLCEKPFAMTAKEAKDVFDYAKEKGLVAMANQNRRYDADMRTVRKVIESGVLGEQNQILGRSLLESILFLDKQCIAASVTRQEMDFYGVTPKDLEGIVSQLRVTRGVEVAVFMYETGAQEFKVSLRSGGKVDVSRVAQYFGGGGHVKAAGFTMAGSVHDVLTNLAHQIEEQLNAE